MKMLTKILRGSYITGLCLLAFIIGGCQSYQLGDPAQLDFKSIYIKPVTNDSFAPQVQALLSAQIRELFIRESRSKLLNNQKEADVILIVNLIDYKRSTAARQADDSTLARSFDLNLYAQVSLFDQNSGSYLFEDRLIRQKYSVYADNPYEQAQSQSLVQAEYQAMPALVRKLARKIADEVLSPWESR